LPTQNILNCFFVGGAAGCAVAAETADGFKHK
jgi:hypothetical protein